MEWTAVVATAVGTVLGVASTLVADRIRWRRERSERDRAELRTSFMEYLGALAQARDAFSRTEPSQGEYIRHGIVSVTVALDVHTGQVVMEELKRNDSAHFIRFLARLQRCIPTGLTIHLILDNGSSHTSKATRAWLKRHPRIVPHYTPKHASWLNQVEIFFSLLARAVLRHGDFSSRTDLLEKVSDFAIVHNETACPFRWNYDGRPRQAGDEPAAAKEECHAR